MTIGPSRSRRWLTGALALGAVRALWLCELPAPVFGALALGALLLATREVLGDGGTLLGHDGHGRWQLAHPGRSVFSGRLVEAGYRGAVFVVLVLEDEAARRRRLAVFADSVAPVAFSRLHLELALSDGRRHETRR